MVAVDSDSVMGNAILPISAADANTPQVGRAYNKRFRTGVGGGAPDETEFGAFSFKIWHLLETILMIFPKLYQPPEKSQPK